MDIYSRGCNQSLDFAVMLFGFGATLIVPSGWFISFSHPFILHSQSTIREYCINLF